MVALIILFLILASVTGFLSLAGIELIALWVAPVFFVIFFVLFLISLFHRLLYHSRPPAPPAV